MEAKTPKGHYFLMQSQSMTHPTVHYFSDLNCLCVGMCWMSLDRGSSTPTPPTSGVFPSCISGTGAGTHFSSPTQQWLKVHRSLRSSGHVVIWIFSLPVILLFDCKVDICLLGHQVIWSFGHMVKGHLFIWFSGYFVSLFLIFCYLVIWRNMNILICTTDLYLLLFSCLIIEY